MNEQWNFSGNKVLVVGRATLDLLIRSDDFPPPGNQGTIHEQVIQPGGSALNIAVSLAQFGIPVDLCCRLGKDAPGRLVKATILQRGVPTDLIKIDSSLPTSLSIIKIGQNAEISILHDGGANKHFCSNDISSIALESYGLVHIGGAMLLDSFDGEPAAEFLSKARSMGILTGVSTTRNTSQKKVLMPLYSFMDYFILNEKESFEISLCTNIEDAGQWFRDKGVKTVVITRGKHGAYISGESFMGHVPGIPGVVRDTTGCGDAFTAGFLATQIAGMWLRLSADWANTTGALCAGTVGALPTPFEPVEIQRKVDTFLKSGGTGALILAGGKSTRMLGSRQKLVELLWGEPLINFPVRNLRNAGVHRIIVLSGHGGDLVQYALRKQPVELINTGEMDLGTGNSVKSAMALLEDLPPYIYVINGDTPLISPEILIRLREELIGSGAAVTLAVARTPDFERYGHAAILTDTNGEFSGNVHFSSGSIENSNGLINTGTYCFVREALINGSRDLFPAGDGKIHFSDILMILKAKKKKICLVYFDCFKSFISINTKEHLLEIENKDNVKESKTDI